MQRVSQRHRVITSTAAVVDQPTPLELDALVAEVDRSGLGGFVVAERRGQGREVGVLQALRDRVGWLVQVTESAGRTACETRLADAGDVLAALVAWTNGLALELGRGDTGARPALDVKVA